MNYEIARLTACAKGLTLSQKSMLLTLSYFSNAEYECFPSFRTLSSYLNISRRHAINLINELEKLEILSKYSDHSFNSNRYRISIDRLKNFSLKELENNIF